MSQVDKDSNLGIAVVGSGYWGRNLIRNFHQLGVLRLICDKNETALAKFKEEYPDVDFCFALAEVLNHEDIEGVVIATPAETHFAIAREALLAGKHVFVEKPLVLSEDDGKELIAIAEENKRVIMVGHLLQFHPAFRELKELVAKGVLGKINYIYSHRLNLGRIRREENILWSFAPHDISMILSLAGEGPESIVTIGGNYLHQRIADVTVTHIDFPSGLKAHIFVSWLHPFKEQKLVVVGDRKMAVFNDTLGWKDKLLLYPHEIKWKNSLPISKKAEPEHVEVPEGEPLRRECEHFLHCIGNNDVPLTNGHEGLAVLRILRSSQRSLDAGGQRIYIGSESRSIERNGEPLKETTRGYFIHPTAEVCDNCKIGGGVKIWNFSRVLSNSRIGDACNIGQNVVVGPNVTIGKNCKIQNNVSVYKGVTLEDGVFCGPSMVFTNIYNPRAEIGKMDQVRPTIVKRGATIGANATIVCGTTLGNYCFVGAGSVVLHNIKDYALVVGNPARQVGWVCECGERLSDDLTCPVCLKRYRESDYGLALSELAEEVTSSM
jgi:UDP-2-acetamido-3-amino-2,3-dideoxy-glucuronate N-acetyltransferase